MKHNGSSALKFQCDKCSRDIVSKVYKRGERLSCPHCNCKIVVPQGAADVESAASSWDKPGSATESAGTGGLRGLATFLLIAGILASCLALFRNEFYTSATAFVTGLLGFTVLRAIASVLEVLATLSARVANAERLLTELTESARARSTTGELG
jgi:DNA-directed RNA polymerase subunit RPC12/RpoP